MILGQIEQLDLLPYLPQKIKQAIEWIRDEVHENTPNGKYEMDGDRCFVIVAEDVPRILADANPEFHRRYIDVQIVLAGAEAFGVCLQKGSAEVILDNRLENDDIAFIQTPSNESVVILKAGDFICFYPNEIHKPLGFVDESITKIKKAIIKIAIDSL